MRNAPPADAACASGGWWLGVQRLLQIVAAASAGAWLAAWAAAWEGTARSSAVVALAAALAGALALAVDRQARRRHAPREGGARLSWDGEHWWLDPGGGAGPVAGSATPILDFGPWLLVRFSPTVAGRRRWLAFDAALGSATLAPLRVALHASGPGSARRTTAAGG